MPDPHPTHTGPEVTPPRIVVAGCGLITPLGHNTWGTYRALLEGHTLGDRAAKLPADIAPVDLVRALGSVKIAQHTADDASVELAEHAAREAFANAACEAEQTPTFIGSSKGAIGAVLAGAERCPDAVALGPHGFLNHRLAARLSVQVLGHQVAACASSLVALDTARRYLMHAGRNAGESHALVVTSEAALNPLFIFSYKRLGVLAPTGPDTYRQTPLAAHRTGFMLCEVGAAMVLKRLPAGVAPAPGEMELVDTGCVAEAHDLIRSTQEMRGLRHLAGRFSQHVPAGGPVMLHPHATGTQEHDPAEMSALADAFVRPGCTPPAVYACKGAIGHGLGAAGLVSAVLACMIGRAGQRPPMPWLDIDGPMPEAPFPIRSERHMMPRQGHHVIVAAGFAGHTAGVLLQQH